MKLHALGTGHCGGARRPISTREVRLLLGARAGGDRITRAGIEARKLGCNLWRLSRAKGMG